MKSYLRFTAAVSVLAALPLTTSAQAPKDYIVAADQFSSTLSRILNNNNAVTTFGLPFLGNIPVPQYMVNAPQAFLFYYSDINNSAIVGCFGNDLIPVLAFGAGLGVSHMCIEPTSTMAWAVNEISTTATVFDPRNGIPLGTVPMPIDLVEPDIGGFPQWCDMTNNGDFTYVCIAGLPGNQDAVVQFSNNSFTEVNRRLIGKSPRVGISKQKLFLPCRDSDAFMVLNKNTLAVLDEFLLFGARGVSFASNNSIFYTTDQFGGDLYAVDTSTFAIVAGPTPSPEATPTNLVFNDKFNRLFVSHPSTNKVTKWKATLAAPAPVHLNTLTVGLAPLGLTRL